MHDQNMVRNRVNRIVISQRDVRQTNHPDQPEHDDVSTSQPGSASTPGFYTTRNCTWCKLEGRHYACLSESTHVHCEVCQQSTQSPPDWTASVTAMEGWAPASGPCCEDCLEVALEGRKKSEVGKQGRELADNVQSWCCDRSEELRYSLRLGWGHVRRWLERTKEKWRLRNVKEQNSAWDNVQYEAEGFLELKVLVTHEGAMQHLEVDFPTDVRISILKQELATLIDVPADTQTWYHLNEIVDETKTLDELHVDIGAIIEVKCRT